MAAKNTSEVGTDADRAIIVATVAAMLAVALASIAWSIGEFLRAALRRQRGLCMDCGYDLTGLPLRRCPECGGTFAPLLAHSTSSPEPKVPWR